MGKLIGQSMRQISWERQVRVGFIKKNKWHVTFRPIMSNIMIANNNNFMSNFFFSKKPYPYLAPTAFVLKNLPLLGANLPLLGVKIFFRNETYPYLALPYPYLAFLPLLGVPLLGAPCTSHGSSLEKIQLSE